MVKAHTQSVNEEIFDRLTRRQISLTRLAAGTSEYLTGVLNRSDPKIASILKDLNASTTKRQLDKALNEFRKVNIDAYLKVEREMKKALTSMSYAEAEHQKTVLKQSTPAEAFRQMKPKTPSKKALREMVESQPYNGALLEEHINGLEQGRYSRVRDVLRREVSAGGTDAAVQDAIMKGVMGTKAANYKDGILDYSRRSLDQKTRTLHNGVAQETRSEFYEQNDDIFDGVLWVSVLDNVTSAICQSLDGTVFPVDEGERPPAHPNCRSEVVPIVKDWEAMGLSDLGPGTRESMTGEVPETQTYNEWLKSQSAEAQDDILGPSRGQMFRDNEWNVDRFVDDTGRKYTLDELAMQEAGQSSAADLYEAPTLTAQEIIDSVDGAQQKIERGEQVNADGVSTKSVHAPNGVYTEERLALHKELIADIFTDEAMVKATPKEGEPPTFTVLGGRGGSGKSWFTQNENSPVNTNAIYLNSDDIKEALPEYNGANAALVHNESKDVIADAIEQAKRGEVSVIYDGTLRSVDDVSRLVDEFKEAGYRIEGAYMYASPETAATRATHRMMRTDRYVPLDYVLGSTTNEKSFDSLSQRFDNWWVYDNDKVKTPQLVERKRI